MSSLLSKHPSKWHILAGLICSIATSHALNVINAGIQNHRFYSDALGYAPQSPNNPLFIGRAYDLSGIAVAGASGGEGHGGGAMMISPHYFITATHFANADTLFFKNRDGVILKKPIESGRAVVNPWTDGSHSTTDLYVGRLSGDGVTVADKIATYPMMMEPTNNWEWYLNKQILVYSTNGGNAAGLNTINFIGMSGVFSYVGQCIYFKYDGASGGYTNQCGLNGESGSPWGLLYEGQIFAGGSHSGYFGKEGANLDYTSLSSFAPHYADQIDAYIAERHPGEKITRQSVNNTAPRIYGANHLTFLPGDTAKSPNLQIIDDTPPANGITLTATSSDQAVLPDRSFSYSGTGNTGDLIVTPPAGVSGKATVTLTASDGVLTASKTFAVTIISSDAGLPTTLQGGSFETPVVSTLTSKFQYGPLGSGWSFNNRAVIQSNGSAWQGQAAPDGTQTAALQGAREEMGAISQALNLAAGSYVLRFKVARRTNQSQLVRFSVDDNQIGTLIEPTSNSFDTYTLQPFTLTAGVHNLRFEVINSYGDNSIFIDLVEMATAEVGFPPDNAPPDQGGSFETPVVTWVVNRFLYNPAGSDWRFTGRSAIQANGSAWGASNAPNGIQTAVLQGTPSALGAISQSITFTGGTYNISFYSARRSNEIQPVKFSVNGKQVGPTIIPASGDFNKYTTDSFAVAAGSHTLRLEATDSTDDRSSFIDRVVIQDLEPSASDIVIPSLVSDAQPLKILSSGNQRGVEYLRPTMDSARSVAETSINLINWLPVSEVPSLNTSLTPAGIGTEKVTIRVQDAATHRFFRLRD